MRRPGTDAESGDPQDGGVGMRAAHRSRATNSASGSNLAVLATAPLGRGDGAEQRGGGVAYAAEIGPRSTRD